MAIVLRYVNAQGLVKERFVGLVHHATIECFNTVLDMQIQEFDDRFSEASTELLFCMSALSPRDSFSMFNSSKLRRLCEFYPKDFNSTDMIELEGELEIYHQRLSLVLPVATATVERCFSSMKIVKSNLRNRIGEEFLNACVICAVEREALAEVKDEDVIERFNHLRLRRGKY
ncbi:uncharacterized protein [Rutidosis leptorrhynchoides]|uniref:uncharacterized protein n=1 Tax=Rutidosis leptorrhynchoides TaxID=125765 RepID=UPI003A9A14BF